MLYIIQEEGLGKDKIGLHQWKLLCQSKQMSKQHETAVMLQAKATLLIRVTLNISSLERL